MDEKTKRIINSEIKIRADYLELLRMGYDLPPGDCMTYTIDQLKDMVSGKSRIKKIDKGSLDTKTTHARFICNLKTGFLWYKLDTFMTANSLGSLDYNPENLPELDFMAKLIEYFDPNNQLGLFKKKVNYIILKNSKNKFPNKFNIYQFYSNKNDLLVLL